MACEQHIVGHYSNFSYYFIMRKLFILFCFLQSCINDGHKSIMTYTEYKHEKIIIKKIEQQKRCEDKIDLAKRIKSVDHQYIKKRIFENCGLKYKKPFVQIQDEVLLEKLDNILHTDQMIRQAAYEVIEKNDFTLHEIIAYGEKHIAKTDSLSLVHFSKIVDSLGEWPGSKYIQRQPGMPPLEILLTHFPEKGYVKYTKMAFHAAQNRMEYWSRVRQMFEYTTVRPIIKRLTNDSIYIFPFRFVEYDPSFNIIEKSGFTILDFETLSNPTHVLKGNKDCEYQIAYELSSSLPEKEIRAKLLIQAKKILMNQGMKQENVKLNYKQQQGYMDYVLYFKYLCI